MCHSRHSHQNIHHHCVYHYAVLILLLACVFISTELRAQNAEAAAIIKCEKAENAYLSKEFETASLYLKQCRQTMPDYLPGLILHGKIHYRFERHSAALKSFAIAISKGANIELFAREWAYSLLAVKDFTTLKNFKAYADFPKPLLIDWLKVRAQACMALSFEGCARESVFQLDSLTVDIVVPLGFAGIAIRNQNWSNANDQLHKALEMDATDIRVWLGFSRVALQQNRFDDALDHVEQASELSPKDPMVLRAFADVYLGVKNLEEAQNTLRIILNQTPNDPYALLVSNSLNFSNKNAKKLKTLKDNITHYLSSTNTPDLAVMYLHGLIAFQQHNYEQALHSFLLLHKERQFLPQSLTLLARTYVALGVRDTATELLEDEQEALLLSSPDAIALLLELFIEQGAIFKAIPLLSEFTKRYPQRIDARLIEAKILFARGLYERGLQLLNSLLREYPTVDEVRLAYVVIMSRTGEPQKALNALQAYAPKANNKANWLNVEGALYLMLSEFDNARQSLMAALEHDNSLLAPRLNLASLEFRSGRVKQALSAIRALKETHPEDRYIATLYAGMLMSSGELDKAKIEYEEIYAKDSTDRDVLEALITLHQRDGANSKVIQLLGRMIDLSYDVATNTFRRGAMYIQMGEINRANNDLYNAMQHANGDAQLLISIANSGLQTNNKRLAMNALRRARTAAPQNVIASVKLIELLLNARHTKEANELLLQDSEKFKNSPEIWVLFGRMAEQLGNLNEAKDAYYKALALDSNFDLVFAKLYTLTTYGVGHTEFEALVTQATTDEPKTFFIRSLLAQYYYYNQRFAEASSHYQFLYDQSSHRAKKAGYARRLAQTYFHVEVDKANQYLAMATDLTSNSHDPHILSLRGWSLVRQQQLESGLTLLREAQAIDSDNIDNLYFIAYALVQLGLLEEARQVTTQLVASTIVFGYRKESQLLLQKITEVE